MKTALDTIAFVAILCGMVTLLTFAAAFTDIIMPLMS